MKGIFTKKLGVVPRNAAKLEKVVRNKKTRPLAPIAAKLASPSPGSGKNFSTHPEGSQKIKNINFIKLAMIFF